MAPRNHHLIKINFKHFFFRPYEKIHLGIFSRFQEKKPLKTDIRLINSTRHWQVERNKSCHRGFLCSCFCEPGETSIPGYEVVKTFIFDTIGFCPKILGTPLYFFLPKSEKHVFFLNFLEPLLRECLLISNMTVVLTNS